MFKMFRQRKPWTRRHRTADADEERVVVDFAGVNLDNYTIVHIHLIVFVVYMLLLVGAFALLGDFTGYSPASEANAMRWIPVWLSVAVCWVIMLFFLHAIRKVDDSYRIRRHYVYSVVILYSGFVPYPFLKFSASAQDAFAHVGLDIDIILVCLSVATHWLMVLLPAHQSIEFDQRRTELLANMKLEQFTQVILDPDVWRSFKVTKESGYFVEQMIILHQSPVYRQHRRVTQSRRRSVDHSATKTTTLLVTINLADIFSSATMLSSSSSSQMQSLIMPDTEAAMAAKVKEIYDEFIAVGSPNELNLSYVTRAKITQEVAMGRWSADALDEALVQVINNMYMNSYGRFSEYIKQNGTTRVE
ncbi:Regulator of G-protein signaling 4 [Sorochytrium milnesiophthora]